MVGGSVGTETLEDEEVGVGETKRPVRSWPMPSPRTPRRPWLTQIWPVDESVTSVVLLVDLAVRVDYSDVLPAWRGSLTVLPAVLSWPGDRTGGGDEPGMCRHVELRRDDVREREARALAY
jgi:hypothetical protein